MPLSIGGSAVNVGTNAVSTGIDAIAYVSEYLTNGSSDDMGVDGSGPAVSFTYSPPAGKNFLLSRFMLYMEAGGNFVSTGFMNLAVLIGGVRISANGAELTNWQDNIDILADMFDLSNAGTAFSNERRSLAGRWTLTRSTVQEPVIVMNGNTVEAFIRDDLSAAGIIFRIKVQGKLIDA